MHIKSNDCQNRYLHPKTCLQRTHFKYKYPDKLKSKPK